MGSGIKKVIEYNGELIVTKNLRMITVTDTTVTDMDFLFTKRIVCSNTSPV